MNHRKSPLTVFLFAALAALSSSPMAQSSWTLRNIHPTCNNLHSVIWKGNKFVAVGDAGTILTSEDALIWAPKKTGIRGNLLSVTWTGKRYVAVGSGGTTLSSEDGNAWNAWNSGTSRDLRGVAWTGKNIVAVSDSGLILTSPDGTAWTEHRTQWKHDLISVDWNGSFCTALAKNGMKFTSTDGETWSYGEGFDTYTFGNMKCIASAGGNQIVVGDSGRGFTTSDGSKWYDAWTYMKINFLGAAITTDSSFVIAGERGTIGTRDRNTTGWEWPKTGTTNTLRSVVRSDSTYVAVGDNGTIVISRDGQAWKTISRGVTKELKSVTWTGSQFVAVGRAILTSSDGIYWTVRDTSGYTTYGLNGATWTGTEVVAVGGYGTYATSPNGAQWTGTSGKATISTFQGVGSNGRLTFAVGSGGMLYSPVKSYLNPDIYILYALTWTGRGFVAVGWSGAIWTSPDGEEWTKRISGNRDHLYSIAGNESQIVAVGDEGTILTSPDGTEWTPRASGVKSNLNGVIWTHRQFVAVGDGGVILTSTDGVDWTGKNSGTNKRLYSVTHTGGKLLAVGENGVIIESPDDFPVGVDNRAFPRIHPKNESPHFAESHSGKLSISNLGLPPGTDVSMHIFDVSRKKLRSFRTVISGPDLYLPRGRLAAGVYYFLIESGKTKAYSRFYISK